MINLIPPQGQKKLQREYVVRTAIVFSILFGFVFMLLSVALIPTYVLVSAQIRALSGDTPQEESKKDLFIAVEEETKNIEKIISQIEKTTSTTLVTPLLAEVSAQTPDGVDIRAYTISEEKGVVQKIQLQGTATTRETLIRFRDNLKASDRFKEAEVPLADLARDSDLPFNISVLLENPK